MRLASAVTTNPEGPLSLQAWLARAKLAVNASATELRPTEAKHVRSVFRRLARTVRDVAGSRIVIPLRLDPSQMRRMTRLRETSAPSADAWTQAVDRVFEALHASGLLQRPSVFTVRREQRALAVTLDPEAFARLPALHRLRAELLQPRSGPERELEEVGVVRAVLGSIIFGGITLPDLCTTLESLDERWLDLDAGCLRLSVPSGTDGGDTTTDWRRFSLDSRSLLLWAGPRLTNQLEAQLPRRHNRQLLHQVPWPEPGHIRAAVRRALQKRGFDSWSLFLRTARLDALLGSLSPLSVARRSGRVMTGTAVSADLRRLGWNLADDGPAARRDHPPQHAATATTGRSTAHTAIRDRIASIVTALNRDLSMDDRHRSADDLQDLLEHPAQADPHRWIDTQVARWGVHLLRRRRYKSKTIRTWLSRSGRFLDALAPPLSSEDLQDPERLATALRRAIATSPAVESRKAMRTTLRQFLIFMANLGVRVAPVNWQHRGLRVTGPARATSLVTMADIRATAEALLHDDQSDGLALGTAVVLAGLGGLRRTEICSLTTTDVPCDTRWTIAIRVSKTAAGRRFVPLAPIVPSWAMAMLQRYAACRATQQTGVSYWLLTRAGQPWDPNDLAARITTAVRAISSTRATLHSLRRAAATWLCVSWLMSETDLHLPEEITAFGFRLDGVRELLGPDPTAALWALAKFLGHRSPTVTLGHYILALDWIETQLMRSAPTQPVPLSFAEATLQLSARRVRQLLPASRGAVPADLLALEVRERLARQAQAAEGRTSPDRILLSRAVSSAPDATKSAASEAEADRASTDPRVSPPAPGRPGAHSGSRTARRLSFGLGTKRL
jgi:site-specific recombinase XerD